MPRQLIGKIVNEDEKRAPLRTQDPRNCLTQRGLTSTPKIYRFSQKALTGIWWDQLLLNPGLPATQQLEPSAP